MTGVQLIAQEDHKAFNEECERVTVLAGHDKGCNCKSCCDNRTLIFWRYRNKFLRGDSAFDPMKDKP